ncbi:MAG: cupin [Kofleriaceae bacterium]|nr:cupin [Kofleriaceae bacterium]
MPVTVTKPWGHEFIWAHTDTYVGKILHINAGESLSLQYHRVKDETIMVLTGSMQFESYLEGETPQVIVLRPHEPVHIVPGMRHRMVALEDTDVLEVSTPELSDVVRLADRYGRTGT